MSKHLETRTDGGEYPASRRPGIDCTEANDLIPALALGAIDTGDRHALRLHCDFCPACAQALEASERAVAFLPFSAPSAVPSSHAKQALFARIERASALTAVTPVLPPIELDAALIDSPSDKRRRSNAVSRSSTERPSSSLGVSWPLSQISGRVGKFAAAPLAIALVLVGLYAYQALETEPDSVPESQTSASADTTVPSAPQSRDTDVEFETLSDDIGTSGATFTQPVQYDVELLSDDSPFVFKSVNARNPTESSSSIAPNPANCKMVSRGADTYDLNVSGVELPGKSRIAGVYLEAADGSRSMITTVIIDQNGNGQTSFSLDRPISDYSTLLIGPLRGGALSAMPMYGAVSFVLTHNDMSLGLIDPS